MRFSAKETISISMQPKITLLRSFGSLPCSQLKLGIWSHDCVFFCRSLFIQGFFGFGRRCYQLILSGKEKQVTIVLGLCIGMIVWSECEINVSKSHIAWWSALQSSSRNVGALKRACNSLNKLRIMGCRSGMTFISSDSSSGLLDAAPDRDEPTHAAGFHLIFQTLDIFWRMHLCLQHRQSRNRHC